jgi:hypothetical protein
MDDSGDLSNVPPDFEREKWLADIRLREAELHLKQAESNRSRWNNPLTIAILAAAVAGLANAALELQKSKDSLALEEHRSEADRILEVIKVGDPDKAANNLQFLIDIGLLSPETSRRMTDYLRARQPGKGPVISETAPSFMRPTDFVDPSTARSMWLCHGDGAEKLQAMAVRDLVATNLRGKYPKADISAGTATVAGVLHYTIDIKGEPSFRLDHHLGFVNNPKLRIVIIFLDRGTENWGTDDNLKIIIDNSLKELSPVNCELSFG